MACVITVNYPFSMFGALQNIEVIVGLSDPGPTARTPSVFVSCKVALCRIAAVVATTATAAAIPDFGLIVGRRRAQCVQSGCVGVCVYCDWHCRGPRRTWGARAPLLSV